MLDGCTAIDCGISRFYSLHSPNPQRCKQKLPPSIFVPGGNRRNVLLFCFSKQANNTNDNDWQLAHRIASTTPLETNFPSTRSFFSCSRKNARKHTNCRPLWPGRPGRSVRADIESRPSKLCGRLTIGTLPFSPARSVVRCGVEWNFSLTKTLRND